MKYAVSAVALAVAAVPAAASAQEANPFQGFSVGGVVGYDHIKVGDATLKESADGATYGVTVGYDYAVVGNGTIGIEAEVADSSANKRYTGLVVPGDVGTVSVGRDLYAGVRAGVALGAKTMLYAKGGYINTRGTVTYTDNAGTNLAASDDLDGFRVGAGVEYSFGRFAARAEYRYSDYGNFKVNGVDTGVDAQRHQAVVSLLARF